MDLHFAAKAEHVGEPDINPAKVLEPGGVFQWFLINIDGVKQKNLRHCAFQIRRL